jgi:poly[(R)-3-hydroxyalkanoate] polymerase subunit PhaC
MTLLWSNKTGYPDRHLAPRPLPAHLASAAMQWLTSRAALPVLKAVSLPSNVSGRQLLDVEAEFDALGTERVERAVAVEVAHRTERYLAGLDAYRRHPYRRHSASPPIVW